MLILHSQTTYIFVLAVRLHKGQGGTSSLRLTAGSPNQMNDTFHFFVGKKKNPAYMTIILFFILLIIIIIIIIIINNFFK